MNEEKTKNLGQIAAIWISSNVPTNQRLIWYDLSEKVHKVYDTSINEWTALNPQVVTNVQTIDDLRVIALGSGLSIGKFFFVVSIGTLAIAITTTKIWYVDNFNNYVVNDLAANITAYLNSNNLLIDGSTGVWNTSTGKLDFSFDEIVSGDYIQSANDYIVIRRKNGNVWSWVKAKLSGFVSAVSGNSISWNSGFYFNLTTSINAIKNITGGIVGFEKHNTDIDELSNSIENVSQGIQQILSQAKDYTDQETSSDSIYSKNNNQAWLLFEYPPLLPQSNSTLHDILNILISWVNVLQNSSRIKVGSGFSSNGRSGNVNYSDSVRTAIEKLIFQNKSIKDSWICNISDYTTTGAVLPRGKVYVYNYFPLECRAMRIASDALPALVFGNYRGEKDGEESSYPFPNTLYVFIMNDDSDDYTFSASYSWDNAPDEFKNLYQTKANNVVLQNDFNVNGRDGDLLVTDSLSILLEKMIFKILAHNTADGIGFNQSFNPNGRDGEVFQTDVLSVAIEKLIYQIKQLQNSSEQSESISEITFDRNWYGRVSVGDEIGEFDSNDNPLYSATVEGALYMLSAWYSKHFHRYYNNNEPWISVNGYYYQWISGSAPSRINFSLSYKRTENCLVLSSRHIRYIAYYDSAESDVINSGGSNNYSNLLLTVNQDIINLIEKKYGVQSIFNLGIPITATDAYGYNKQSRNNNVAVGSLYGCVIQAEQGALVSEYLKLIPVFTHAIIGKEVDGESGDILSPSQSGVTFNDLSLLGSNWLYGLQIFSQMSESCIVNIPDFSVQIPLF